MTGEPGETAIARAAAPLWACLAGAVPGGTGPDARRHQRTGQVLLGLIWAADGVLRLQPYMFGKSFMSGVLAPTGQQNPVPVAHSITAMASFLEPHIAVWNVLFAVTQLAIGAGLMLGVARAVAPAGPAWTVLFAVVCLAVGPGVALRLHEGAFLALAVAVATAIWVLGDGLAGILTGRGTDPNTAPPLALPAFVLWEGRTAKRSEEGAEVLSLEGGKA